MTELERVIVLVEPDEKDRLVQLSELADRSMSKYMRRLLQKDIERADLRKTGKRLTPGDFSHRPGSGNQARTVDDGGPVEAEAGR